MQDLFLKIFKHFVSLFFFARERTLFGNTSPSLTSLLSLELVIGLHLGCVCVEGFFLGGGSFFFFFSLVFSEFPASNTPTYTP